jgi:CubicO group peptidase (beta-lactamase class C family)
MKMKSSVAFRMVAVFLTGFAGLSQARAQQAPLNGFDQYVENAMKAWQVPGVALGIIKDGHVVLAKGYGVRTISDHTPVDEHTMFAVASCTKSFTTAALAMLVDEGKVKWSDPVIQHLPGFQLSDPWVTRHITVTDLVTHRTFPDDGGGLLYYSFGATAKEIVQRLRYQKLNGEFRAHYSYNNSMYVTAGRIVASAANESYDDFVTQRILRPLGMTSTNFHIADLKSSNDVSTGYAVIDGKVQAVQYHSVDDVDSAGGLNSNLTDMLQWLQLQLGEGNFNGHQLISPKSFKEIQTPQMIIRLGGPLKEMLGPGANFYSTGLGWNIHDYRGHVIVEKGGDIDGQSSEVAMMPDLHVGFVLLSNLNNSFLRNPLMYRIFDAYLGGPQRDWSAEMLPEFNAFIKGFSARQKKLEASRPTGTSPSLPLEKYAGTFHNDYLGDVKIADEGGKLILRRLGNYEYAIDLENWAHDTFRASWKDNPTVPDLMFTYTLTPDGKADTFKIDSAPDYPFQRVAENKDVGASSDSANRR